MKIIYKAYAGGGEREVSLMSAVQDAATADPYSYEGQIERLNKENEKLRDMLARLMETMFGEVRYTNAEAVEHILGYGYEVEE